MTDGQKTADAEDATVAKGTSPVVVAIFALGIIAVSPAIAAEVDVTVHRSWWDTMRAAVGRERFDGGDVGLWESRGFMHRRFVVRGGDESVARVMRRFCGTVEDSWSAGFWRQVERDVVKAHPDRAGAFHGPCDGYSGGGDGE